MDFPLRTVLGVVDEWELQCLYAALKEHGVSIYDVEMGEEPKDMYATVIVHATPARRDLLLDKWSELLKEG